MSSLADRLRGVVRPGASHATTPAPEGVTDRVEAVPRGDRPRGRTADPAEVLGGEWRDVRGQRFATVDRTYLPGHRHGHVAVADGLPPQDGWARLPLLAGGACGGRLLFVDLETTGLAGGAGTQAFLVGCAWFDGGVFRVRQFLLTTTAAERAMLEAVAELAGGADTVVTFNGKTFDLPLIETRYLFQRMETPFGGMPHVDMLHAARRLWRADDSTAEGSGCRLGELERVLCGHERDGDVPGFEIPARYFHFVRTGDARPLADVLEHNRLDLLSLALLTARAAQVLDEGPSGARSAREAHGMGRYYERAGLLGEARECYARAAGLDGAPVPGDDPTRAEALRAFALLARRQRRHDDAARAWRRALDLGRCPAGILREATEALAVHHEHRLRQPKVARSFALKALDYQGSAAGRRAVQHRLERLGRKLGEPVLAELLDG